jgi:hypothetical protein
MNVVGLQLLCDHADEIVCEMSDREVAETILEMNICPQHIGNQLLRTWEFGRSAAI